MRLPIAVLVLLAFAPAAVAAPNVEIRRTSHGIPHIRAGSYEGLGYGYGYAFAQDNLCEIAETYVTVSAERSRYFGPDGTYASRGNGTRPNNLNSDVFFQRLKDDRVVEGLLASSGVAIDGIASAQPPAPAGPGLPPPATRRRVIVRGR